MMTDDRLEDLIRSRLRASAPRDVPEQLALRAATIPLSSARSDRWSPTGRRSAARWRFAVAGIALASIVVLATVLVSINLGGRNDVAATGLPTLPAVTQPSLPPGAAQPTRIVDGAWVSPTVAWLVDDRYRLRITTDGGLTWSEPRPLPHDDLRGSPTFIDGSTGYAVWAPQDANPLPVIVYVTRDGGRTWSSTTVGTLPSKAGDTSSLTAHFSDPRHVVVLAGAYQAEPVPSAHAGVGLHELACAGWSTDDGGMTWVPLAGAPCSDHDEWASPMVGIILPSSDGGPVVSLTLDGGLTWRSGTLPAVGVDDAPVDVVFTVAPDGAPRYAYWVDRPTEPTSTPKPMIVAETHDGGATWQEAYETADPRSVGLGPVTALGPDHWLATGVAAQGTDTSPIPMLETTDGGRAWTRVGTLGTIDGESRGWLDRLHGMAGGQDNSGCAQPSGTPCHVNGYFLTNDGGQTWHGVPF